MRKEVAVVNHSYESRQITTSKHVTIQTIPQGEHRRNKRLIRPISNLLKRMGMPIQVNPISTPRKKTIWNGMPGRRISSIKNLEEHTKASHILPIPKITGQITIKQKRGQSKIRSSR